MTVCCAPFCTQAEVKGEHEQGHDAHAPNFDEAHGAKKEFVESNGLTSAGRCPTGVALLQAADLGPEQPLSSTPVQRLPSC